MFSWHLVTICLATLLLTVSVSAGLYGTNPTASTVWSAGRSQTVTWMDDKSSPHLDHLGLLNIELLASDDTPVATLARDVDPGSKSQNIWISPAWGHNDSDYYIRFDCKKPQLSIYTASFTIIDMSSIPAAGQQTQPNPTTGGFFTPYLTLVLPNETTVATLAPQRTSTKPSPTLAPISPEDEDAYLHSHSPKTNNAGESPIRHRFDFERLKFRMVFVVWPALIGITMAL